MDSILNAASAYRLMRVQKFYRRSESILSRTDRSSIFSKAPNARSTFNNLIKAKARLGILDDSQITNAQWDILSSWFGMSPDRIRVLNEHMNGDYSLNAPVSHKEENKERQDFLVCSEPDQEENLGDRQESARRAQLLKLGLAEANLTQRAREILIRRRLTETPDTLETLGSEYSISKERVRQIEEKSFAKLKAEIFKADKHSTISNASMPKIADSMRKTDIMPIRPVKHEADQTQTTHSLGTTPP